jgi:hypothetical protein
MVAGGAVGASQATGGSASADRVPAVRQLAAAEATPVVFERRVGVSADDAEESATGSMSLNSSDLELVNDGNNQKVGMRFTNVTVPKGATVTRAYIQFETDETQSETTNLLIQGQAADNAATFTTTASNISGRSRTSATVAWTPPAWTLISEAGANQRTPDLATPLQEIVNRAGWASGNALALIITGTGHRTARAYDGKPTGAPLLHIEYTTGPPPPPQAPLNTAAPTISGSAVQGATLRADPGSWSGTAPIAFSYQWRSCDAGGTVCSDTGSDAPTYALGAADVGQRIGVTVTGSNTVGTSNASSALTAVVAPSSGADPVIAAAGDLCSSSIGDCAGTADLLDLINPTAVLVLGDNAYENGSLTEYNAEYKPYWGRQDFRVYPSPGNHEFQTAGAQGYLDYFGARAPGLWYSFDLGAWHIVSLAGDEGVSAAAGSPQEQFLRSDLAAHPSQCTLVFWHEPRFSSGAEHGNDTGVSAIWDDLYAAGVDLVLNGHEHNYERFDPQNPSGVADANGIREFIVGTGGAEEGSYPFGTPVANSVVRNTGTAGVIKLTLHPGSYDWVFVPAAGFSFTDSGSSSCH